MSRWDPGAEQRLRKAALDLYHRHGYDNVTINQIAEHAGLTRRSYFRYFADKREVLFGGSDQLSVAVTEALRAADPALSPWPAVLAVLADIGARLAEIAEDSDVRRSVIAASVELQERERTKMASISTAIADVLEERGVPSARLMADVATVVFQNAFTAWIDARGQKTFNECLDCVVRSLGSEIFEFDH